MTRAQYSMPNRGLAKAIEQGFPQWRLPRQFTTDNITARVRKQFPTAKNGLVGMLTRYLVAEGRLPAKQLARGVWTRTGAQVDDPLAELDVIDEVLNALAKAETLLRRHRQLVAQLNQVKGIVLNGHGGEP